MNIGDRLRKIRTEQNLSAKKLSEESGVPEKTIYRIETGEVKDPKLSSLEPLIKTLNCSADELLFDIDEFTGLAKLRQIFAKATELNDYDFDLLVTLVNKFLLASSIEREISDAMRDGRA